ncbi:MAG: ParB/RepB/Spo0J family partition protein [Firmicutes bacterium]|nr:ParB/RepB/Spo0J family partition protein [Bacillota bacterium]
MEKKKRSILSFIGGQQDSRREYKNIDIEEFSVTQQIISVPIKDILANPEQPRKIFYDEAIKELSGSIKEYGVLQPIILKKESDGYIIIAGERRFRAAQMAGLSEIPALVKNMEDQEAALVSLVENVQREDLNFLEEARAYKRLMEDFGLTQVEIAEKVNKKQSTISNKIRILALPEDIQEKLIQNKLTERHARALLKLNDQDDRKKVTERVVANNLNVKQTEKLIEELLMKKEEAFRKKNKINYISYKIYLNTIRKAFSQIKEMEKNAKMTQEDRGDFLEVKIILPKSDRCFT